MQKGKRLVLSLHVSPGGSGKTTTAGKSLSYGNGQYSMLPSTTATEADYNKTFYFLVHSES